MENNSSDQEYVHLIQIIQLLQVFSSAGVFIRTFGSKGTGPGEFDRPSGICISPEGHVIVVDFGNDRVQVF